MSARARTGLPTWLDAALHRLLPTRTDTHLLRALLLPGPEAAEAWRDFRAGAGDVPSLFRADTGGRKRLGPLLLRALGEHAIDEDPATLTVLRTSRLREEMRDAAYGEILGDVLDAIAAAGLDPVVVGGAAQRATAYPEPCLRHAHHVELLVEPDDAAPALSALDRSGLGRPVSAAGTEGAAARVVHRSGVPILVRTGLYDLSPYRSDAAGLRGRSGTRVLEGRAVRVLAPEDRLAHALGRASYRRERASLVWAVDACRTVATGAELDWDRLSEHVADARLAVPMTVMLRYLAEELGAAIPAGLLERAAEQARRSAPLHVDVALYGARQAPGRRPPRAGGLARWRAVRRQLVPSRAYMEWAHGARALPGLVAAYGARPLSWAAEQVRWRLAGRVRRPDRAR